MTLLERVEQALDTIRPYLETDGGNVSIEEITEENVVRLKLLGACASCSMSIMTFKAGLEQAIKKAVPEITAVEAINITDMGLNDDYRAAVIAFENVLKQYPDTKYAEEIEFLMIKAQYNYAAKSSLKRQDERFSDAISFYRSFASNYPDSKFMKDAEDLRNSAEKNIEIANKKLQQIKVAIAEQEKINNK